MPGIRSNNPSSYLALPGFGLIARDLINKANAAVRSNVGLSFSRLARQID
jgi:hypothetical protein